MISLTGVQKKFGSRVAVQDLTLEVPRGEVFGLLGHNDKVQYDPRKFTWLGSSSNFSDDAYVMIVRNDAPAKSIDDARRSGSPSGVPYVEMPIPS